jgi:PAS domain S-box-containing protein
VSDGTDRSETAADNALPHLRASEERFAALFERSPFAVALTRMPEGITVGANEAFLQLFGYDRDAVIGRTSIDLGINNPVDRSQVAAEFASGRGVHGFECTRTTSSGEQRVLSLDLERIDLESVEHVLTTITDITERRQAEESLRESERRFRGIVETTAEGVLMGTPDGTIRYVNGQMADMLGYSVEELMGMPGLDLVFPDWEPKVNEYRAALGSGEVLRGEMKLRRRDGEAVWTLFSSSPMLDEAGCHVANLTMHADITDRVHAEQALKQKTEELRAALRRMRAAERASTSAETMLAEVNDAIIAVDSRSRVTYLNRHAARQYGVDPASAVGRPLTDLYAHEWPSPEAEAEASEQLERTGRWRGENVHVTRDGRRLHVETAVSVLVDGAGAQAGMLSVIRDVGERKAAERALREREADAAALAERNRLARDLHDSVTQALFAASLRAESITLDGESLPPHIAEALEEVRRLTRGALAQMRAMLVQLRSDSVTEIPIQTLLAQLVEAAESRARVDVSLRLRGEAPPPAAVHDAVYHIVQEALNNVTRHAHAATAWVELELLPSAVHLEVGDDGRGFDAGAAGPTHLGLRTMQERATEAGMAMHIDTRPGEGTVVRVDWAAAASETPGMGTKG